MAITTGDTITAADVLAIAATRELFFPVTYSAPAISTDTYIPVGPLADASHVALMAFFIPADFLVLTSAVIWVIPKATQANANWDIFSWYAQDGEPRNTHAETDAAATYNVTDNQNFEVDVSGILTALAALDRGGIQLLLQDNAHDVNVVGLYIKYA